MLTGSLPFKASSASGLAQLHLDAVPPKLGSMIPNVAPALEQIMEKVLSKEPSMRYRTADQFGRVLQIIGSEKVKTTPALSFTPEIPEANFMTEEPGPIDESSLDIDWISVGLGLLALLMVGGLIPFWVWVYFIYHPPIR